MSMHKTLKLAITSSQAHDELYLRPALEASGHTVRALGALSIPSDVEPYQDFDAVVSFVGDCLDAATFEKLATLGVRLVVQRAAGVDNIDLDAARKLGLCVAHVPAYSPESVAEHAATLLLAIARNLPAGVAPGSTKQFQTRRLAGLQLAWQDDGHRGHGTHRPGVRPHHARVRAG